jgi:cytochrome c-type biogenesis protein CcmF
MIAETGHFLLCLALALSLIQIILPFWGLWAQDRVLINVAPYASVAVFLALLLSFLALTSAYLSSDFSVVNVAENSHSQVPLLYKFTGVWGNHEGSMLLWVLILGLFGALVGLSPSSLPERLRAGALVIQGLITTGFLLFLLGASNPFLRLEDAPFEGRDLNPLLQDIGLAIHPPLLYVGYVGFSIVFAFAAAALIEGKIDAIWARAVRPWALLAWSFLTLGIAMGSYWAYYELGWGGWWFWDPVENASLLPWLSGTALIHSIVVMEKRDALKVWTILLAILTFSLSLMGTFLVRSGILTSVHAFAVDPARGLYILVILIFFIGGALALFAWRAPLLKRGGLFAPVSREGALIVNNLLLSTACATVLVGTLYPLALEGLTGTKISVGPPYFNAVFVPVFLPLLLLLPLGQSMSWKRGDFFGVVQRLMMVFAISILATILLVAVTWGGPVAAPLGIGLGLYLVLGAGFEISSRSFKKGESLSAALRRASGLPLSAFGSALAHAGIGLSVIGIAATAWSVESLTILKVGESIHAGPYAARLESITPRKERNYRDDVLLFTILKNEDEKGQVETIKRLYIARDMPTTEAGILTTGLTQVYLSAGEILPEGRAGVKMFYKPLVLLIWLGALVMAIGGCLSLMDRRLRIGVPKAKIVKVGWADAHSP